MSRRRRVLHFVRVDGHLIRVSVRGEGRPLLLIMGLGGNIEMWDPLERALNARGVQTIAYDASGTGESPARIVPLRMHGLARQAAHLLDALGHPRADILGVSFGGAVAQELTLTHQHRIRRLVLASTMCGLGGVPGNPLALVAPGDTAALLLADLHAPHRRHPLRTASERGPRPHPPPDRGPPSSPAQPVGLPRTARGRAPVGRASRGCTASAHRPSCSPARPTPSSHPSTRGSSPDCIPGSELEIVPDAGHLLLMDHAERSAIRIAQFLSD